MSRRTKLIILGTFLLLLSAAAGAIFLTWTTPSPLRFRAIECRVVSNPGQSDELWKVRMVVENVSHIPVHLFEARVRKPRSHKLSRMLNPASGPGPKAVFATVEFDPRTVPQSRFSIRVSPGQTHECHFYVYHKKGLVQWLQDVDVQYSWISYTASKADYLRARLRKIVPEQWRSRIPSRLFERDITPMDSDALPPTIMPVLVDVTPEKAAPVTAPPTPPSPATPSHTQAHRRRFFTAPLPVSTSSPFQAAPPSPAR